MALGTLITFPLSTECQHPLGGLRWCLFDKFRRRPDGKRRDIIGVFRKTAILPRGEAALYLLSTAVPLPPMLAFCYCAGWISACLF